jgi:predicted PurR-regulated permease PerM
MNTTNIINYRITTETMFRFCGVLLFILSIWYLQDLFISLLVSVILASAINPLATKLRTWYIPRALTTFVVLGGLISFLAMIVFTFIPIVTTEMDSLRDDFPRLQKQFSSTLANYTGGLVQFSEYTKENKIKDFAGLAQNTIGYISGGISNTAKAITTFLFQTLIIFVITFYLAVQERGVERFLRIITPIKHEEYVLSLWERSQKKISAWVKGQFILSVIMGLTVYVGLTILGMSNAITFALLASLGEVIPVVGMLLATIPAVLYALSGSLYFAFMVYAFYFVIGQIENNILAPYVVNKIVGVPSVVVVLSLLIGGIFAGFWGVLIAVPVAAAILEFVQDIESNKKQALESMG